MFDLAAVVDFLAEHAVFIPQAIADRGNLERRQRIDKTGGQPAQAAIAQPGVWLLLEQHVPVLACIRGEVVADELLYLQIGNVVGKRSPDQKTPSRGNKPAWDSGGHSACPVKKPAPLREQVADRAGHRSRIAGARVGLLLRATTWSNTRWWRS